MEIEIQKKPQKTYIENTKVASTEDVFNLLEVQNIKDAIQEHLLFIGLDRRNNIRTINLLGIGSSSGIFVDSKDILRTALLTASERVVLVHNHPSNNLKASNEDIHLSNITNRFLKVFNIQLLDHIIVAENGYLSMGKEDEINRDYENNDIKFVEKTFLIEENIRLKNENEKLKIMEEKFMNKYESIIIIKPTLTDDEIKDTINKYKENFEKLSNKPVNVEDMGKKKLAYDIQGNTEGHYAIYNFYAKSEDISEIDRNYRIDDNVIKFMNIKQDMEAEETSELMEDEDDMEL